MEGAVRDDQLGPVLWEGDMARHARWAEVGGVRGLCSIQISQPQARKMSVVDWNLFSGEC